MSATTGDIRIIRAEKKHVGDCAGSLGGSAISERYFADKAYMRRLVRTGIDKKEIYIGIAGCDTVAGFYWASAGGMFCRFSYLRLLAVRPPFRGRGVGRKLLRHFEENGFKKAAKVFLAVSDFNTGARRFYERSGYVRVGALPDLYKPGIAEILMVKSL